MIRIGYLILFQLTFCFSLHAQITIGQFIQSTERDAELKAFVSQMEYLATKPYKLSPIQKLEFRTRTNLDFSRYDYALRLNPANPWEVRNNSNYFKAYQQSLSFEKEIAFSNALLERYILISEYLYYQALKRLKEEDKKLTDTQVAILEAQQASSFFDTKDYLELKVDQMTNMVELEEVEFEIENQSKRIGVKYSGTESITINWDNETVITMERLEMVADSLLREEIPSTAVAYQEQRIRVATQEYKLEKSNIGVGYVQAQYQPFRTEQDREPWNIALGVTIPLFNPNKGDMAKRQLDVIEAEHELSEEKSERNAKTVLIYERLKGQLARNRDIEKKILELNSGALSNTLKTMDSGNPIIVVRFNSTLIKLKTLQAKLQLSILTTYTEFLGYTDRLQRRPLVNYLSPKLDNLN